MINYESICAKLGFDPIVDTLQFPVSDHEDDRWTSPFKKLTDEELSFLTEYLIQTRDKLRKYIVQ